MCPDGLLPAWFQRQRCYYFPIGHIHRYQGSASDAYFGDRIQPTVMPHPCSVSEHIRARVLSHDF